MAQMFLLYPLYENIWLAGAGQDQRGPDFLFGLLIVQNAPHAKRRCLAASSIGNARHTAGGGIYDAVVYLLGSARLNSGEQTANLALDLFEMRGHIIGIGSEISNAERPV